MAICPYCGSQIGDEAEICGFCGGKLTLDFKAPPEKIAQIPEAATESEYEGIPDDILGSVLGSLGGRSAPAEDIPEIPPVEEVPVIPTIEEILDIPAAEDLPEVPAVEEVLEAPAVDAVPEVPVIKEVPEAPAEEIPAVPAVEEAFEAPAAEEVPAAEQPVYAQPVYAQPAEPKKNKWVVPAIILGALALIGILFFAARGGSGSKASDPNLGLYKATVAEMYGLVLNADDIYEEGFTIELKENGVCEIISDGDKGRGNWTLEGDQLTIDDGHSSITGTLSDGVLKLENMLDMGLDMTFEKQE